MDLWHHHTELGYSTHCPSANNPLFIQKPIDILFRGIILMDSVKRFYCTMYEKSVISKLCKVPPICAYSVCPNYGFVFYVTVYIYLKLCQFEDALPQWIENKGKATFLLAVYNYSKFEQIFI